jgi:uncharacterized protein (DUF58 family)
MAEYLKHALNFRRKAEQAAADLPALMALAERAVSSIVHGEHAQRKAGPGEKFWQFREYSPSDRPQDIDWRQSARTDRVYVRQREWQTAQQTMLWCASGPGMEFSSYKNIPAKGESAKVLTLALSLLLTRAGEHIGMLGSPRTGRSENMLEAIGNTLCDPGRAAQTLPDIGAQRLSPNTNIFQIGDFLEPIEKTEGVFKFLAGQSANGIVVQVLDPAEIDLPYQGRVIFEEPAGKAREVVNHVTSIREAYQKRMQDHLFAVETLTRQCRWHYFLHRTDEPLTDILARIWASVHQNEFHTAGNT